MKLGERCTFEGFSLKRETPRYLFFTPSSFFIEQRQNRKLCCMNKLLLDGLTTHLKVTAMTVIYFS